MSQFSQGISTSNLITNFTDVTAATQTLEVQNGYATDRSGGVTYLLPASAVFGQLIQITGKLGLATVTQNANQRMQLGSGSTTIGVGGSLTSTNVGDCLTLRCITGGSSTVWRAEASQGNWTVV